MIQLTFSLKKYYGDIALPKIQSNQTLKFLHLQYIFIIECRMIFRGLDIFHQVFRL